MRELISTGQVTVLVALSQVSVTLVYFPPMANPELKQDVWLGGGILGALWGIPFAWVLSRLWLRFPRHTFAAVAELVLGRVVGKIVVFWYAYLLFWGVALNLRMVGEFFIFAFLPRTPIIVIIGVVAFLVAWAAAAGVEVMGRAATVIFPPTAGAILLVFVLMLKEIEFRALAPVFIQSGAVANLKAMFNVVGRTGDLIIVGLLVPFIREPRGLLRAVSLAFVSAGLLWIFMAITITGTMAAYQELIYFPYFTTARQISVAEFVENLDAILLGIWFFGMFLRVGLLLWGSAVSAAQGLGLKEYRPLVIPLAGIAVTHAILQAESFSELRGYLRPETFTPFLFTSIFLIPVLVLAVAVVRRKRGDEAAVKAGNP